MSALRRFYPKIDFSASDVSYELLESLSVTTNDFYSSLNEIEPSAIGRSLSRYPASVSKRSAGSAK